METNTQNIDMGPVRLAFEQVGLFLKELKETYRADIEAVGNRYDDKVEAIKVQADNLANAANERVKLIKKEYEDKDTDLQFRYSRQYDENKLQIDEHRIEYQNRIKKLQTQLDILEVTLHGLITKKK